MAFHQDMPLKRMVPSFYLVFSFEVIMLARHILTAVKHSQEQGFGLTWTPGVVSAQYQVLWLDPVLVLELSSVIVLL